jgi:hypothetical protein
LIEIEYIPTAEMATDIPTKPLKRQLHKRNLELLGFEKGAFQGSVEGYTLHEVEVLAVDHAAAFEGTRSDRYTGVRAYKYTGAVI